MIVLRTQKGCSCTNEGDIVIAQRNKEAQPGDCVVSIEDGKYKVGPWDGGAYDAVVVKRLTSAGG